MAPPLRATAEAESSSVVNSLSATVPASTEVGDLIVVVSGATSSTTYNALSGYTNIADERAGTASFRLAVWRKVAAPGDAGASVTPSLSASATGEMIVQVRVYHSVDTTTPMDAAPVIDSDDTASTSVVAPAITSVTAGAWIVSIHGQPTTSATTITSWGDPAGANNELISCSTDGSGNQSAVVSYDYDTTAAGSYGPYTATSPQSRKWSAVTLALRPGAVSVSPTARFTLGASATVAAERSVSPTAGIILGASATVSTERSVSPTAGIILTATAVVQHIEPRDLEVTILAARDDGWRPAADQTLVAKYSTVSNQRGWRLGLDASGDGDVARAGRPMLVWSPDGTVASNITVTATERAPIDPYGKVHLRVLLDADNEAGGWTVTFETADADGNWVQLGDQVTGSGVTWIFETTAPLTVGAYLTGSGPSERFVGRVYSLQVREGRTGPISASVDFTNHPTGTETFIDSEGNTWDIHAPAALVSSQTPVSLAILGPLATDECDEWADFTLPRTGVGLTCDNQPEPCCSYYRVRTVGRVGGALLVSEWVDADDLSICFEWDLDEHLIRTLGPDGPMYALVKGMFEWDRDRPFTASTGVNGSRFVTSAPPGGRNMSMVAAVESETELATLHDVLARPLVLISPSDSSEVWAAPVSESVKIIKVGRIRQVTADFIATGPEPGPQLADVGE